jgi:hypothetical protein
MAVVVQGAQQLASLNGSIAMTSGVAPGTVFQRLLLNITTAGAVTVTTLDGTVASLGTLQPGAYSFDIQFLSATFPAGTGVGFYRIEG